MIIFIEPGSCTNVKLGLKVEPHIEHHDIAWIDDAMIT